MLPGVLQKNWIYQSIHHGQVNIEKWSQIFHRTSPQGVVPRQSWKCTVNIAWMFRCIFLKMVISDVLKYIWAYQSTEKGQVYTKKCFQIFTRIRISWDMPHQSGQNSPFCQHFLPFFVQKMWKWQKSTKKWCILRPLSCSISSNMHPAENLKALLSIKSIIFYRLVCSFAW